MATILGVPAARQVIGRLHKSAQEENSLLEKLEKSCVKFDHRNRGGLKVDEYYNVIKLQNGIDITKSEVSIRTVVQLRMESRNIACICVFLAPEKCHEKFAKYSGHFLVKYGAMQILVRLLHFQTYHCTLG